jgi:hypothetical protein
MAHRDGLAIENATVGDVVVVGLEVQPNNPVLTLADDVYLFRHQFRQAIFITSSA